MTMHDLHQYVILCLHVLTESAVPVFHFFFFFWFSIHHSTDFPAVHMSVSEISVLLLMTFDLLSHKASLLRLFGCLDVLQTMLSPSPSSAR